MAVPKNPLFLILALLFVLSLLGVAYKYRTFQPDPPKIGTAAPVITDTTLSGQYLQLRDFRGRYVLLDFWGMWCGPCRVETPHLKQAYARFHPQVMFIGIPVNDDPQSVLRYIADNKMPWPQLRVQHSGFRGTSIPWDYGIDRYPSQFLVDPSGTIIVSSYQTPDALQGDQLMQTLEATLKNIP